MREKQYGSRPVVQYLSRGRIGMIRKRQKQWKAAKEATLWRQQNLELIGKRKSRDWKQFEVWVNLSFSK